MILLIFNLSGKDAQFEQFYAQPKMFNALAQRHLQFPDDM
jgi:hypothetical protein